MQLLQFGQFAAILVSRLTVGHERDQPLVRATSIGLEEIHSPAQTVVGAGAAVGAQVIDHLIHDIGLRSRVVTVDRQGGVDATTVRQNHRVVLRSQLQLVLRSLDRGEQDLDGLLQRRPLAVVRHAARFVQAINHVGRLAVGRLVTVQRGVGDVSVGEGDLLLVAVGLDAPRRVENVLRRVRQVQTNAADGSSTQVQQLVLRLLAQQVLLQRVESSLLLGVSIPTMRQKAQRRVGNGQRTLGVNRVQRLLALGHEVLVGLDDQVLVGEERTAVVGVGDALIHKRARAGRRVIERVSEPRDAILHLRRIELRRSQRHARPIASEAVQEAQQHRRAGVRLSGVCDPRPGLARLDGVQNILDGHIRLAGQSQLVHLALPPRENNRGRKHGLDALKLVLRVADALECRAGEPEGIVRRIASLQQSRLVDRTHLRDLAADVLRVTPGLDQLGDDLGLLAAHHHLQRTCVVVIGGDRRVNRCVVAAPRRDDSQSCRRDER